jgi:hypothetical protein
VFLLNTVLFPHLQFMLCLNKQDKEEQKRAAEAKKTDAVTPDDSVDQQAPVKATKSKSHLEVQEEEEEQQEQQQVEQQEQEEAEASGGEVDTEAPKTEVN